VPYTATFQEITRAYRDKMKRTHPDRDRRTGADERAKLLNEAFRTLSRTESRRAYDAQIKASAVQEQIMGRYVGGFPPVESNGASLRRVRTAEDLLEEKRADRSAAASVFVVFTGITFAVIMVLLVSSFLHEIIELLT
jgi:curved DNA-binding protein CbpA